MKVRASCFLALSLVLFCTSGSLLAQPPASTQPAPVATNGWPSQPGDYNMTESDGQLVMKSYKVTGITPDNRSILARMFKNLLAKDGRGGCAETPVQVGQDKKAYVLLVVTATPLMQETVGQTVEQINQGSIEVCNTGVTNKVFRPRFRSAASIAEALKAETSSVGYIFYDPILNAVTIEEQTELFNFLWKLAEDYDQPSPKVMCQVHVVEFVDGNDRNVGTNWSALLETLPASVNIGIESNRAVLSRDRDFTGANGVSVGSANDRTSGLQVADFTTAINQISPQAAAAFLNYLETKGVCKVVSKTDIHVVNCSTNTVSTEVAMPVTAIVPNSAGGKLRQDLTIMEGIKLTIEGTLAQEGRRLNVKATSTSIVSYNPNGVPVIATSNLDTTAHLGHNQTLVLSGLSRIREIDVVHQSPLLGNLDALHLFSQKGKHTQKWQLYICITTKDSSAEVEKPFEY